MAARVTDTEEAPGRPRVHKVVLRCMHLVNGEMRTRNVIVVRDDGTTDE